MRDAVAKHELPVEILELMAQRFAALADVNRLRILQRLRQGEATVNQLAQELGLSQPNTSAHLAVLRASRLVVVFRRGKNAFYRLADDMTLSLCEIVCGSVRKEFEQMSHLLAAGDTQASRRVRATSLSAANPRQSRKER